MTYCFRKTTKNLIKTNNTMTTKQTKQFLGGDSYISPEIRTVEFKAEGPLCVSFGPATYGFMIEDATEDDWGTL